jgi:hypothetical protein
MLASAGILQVPWTNALGASLKAIHACCPRVSNGLPESGSPWVSTASCVQSAESAALAGTIANGVSGDPGVAAQSIAPSLLLWKGKLTADRKQGGARR